ncbi:MAG: RNA-binding protein, partial [Bacteroidota bacterium]|nr:RNA-binding protein [Bacteroidota bacterium]
PLPIQAQFAPVFGMTTADYNQDGALDLLLVGNSYATETTTGYYDASYGTLLAGNGKGKFTAVSPAASGFKMDGDAKAMVQLQSADNKVLVLVSTNSDSLRVVASYSKPSQQIKMQPNDAYAELQFKNGKRRRQEIPYGSGYLSQSARALLESNLTKVVITDFSGKERQIKM